MSKQKPVIGLTTVYNSLKKHEYYLSEKYVELVKASGGLPIMLPNLDHAAVEQLADMLDAVVLSGGPDVPPNVYGGASRTDDLNVAPLAQIQFELKLIQVMLKRRKPILGICLGHQLLNIAFGGTLIQDIPSEVPGAIDHSGGYVTGHSGPHRGRRHKVYLSGPSRLREIVGVDKFFSRSYHHQSVDTPGRGVRVVARASDGVVEATEFPTEQLIISVQWHPEAEQDSVYTQRIFRALVAAASQQQLKPAAAGKPGSRQLA